MVALPNSSGLVGDFPLTTESIQLGTQEMTIRTAIWDSSGVLLSELVLVKPILRANLPWQCPSRGGLMHAENTRELAKAGERHRSSLKRRTSSISGHNEFN